MTAVTHKTLWAALAAAALSTMMACPTPPPVKDGGGGGGGTTGDCVEDSDCPDPQYFFCNTVTSQCEPSCRTAAQCNPASVSGGQRPAQYALDFCTGSLGCQCDEGKCVGSLCSADSDCGTQVCRSGACVAPPAATAVARCQVSPDFAVFAAGSKARFWVSAWDAQNNPIGVPGTPTDVRPYSVTTTTGSAIESAGLTAAQRVALTTNGLLQVQFSIKTVNGTKESAERFGTPFVMTGLGMCLGSYLGGIQQ